MKVKCECGREHEIDPDSLQPFNVCECGNIVNVIEGIILDVDEDDLHKPCRVKCKCGTEFLIDPDSIEPYRYCEKCGTILMTLIPFSEFPILENWDEIEGKVYGKKRGK